MTDYTQEEVHDVIAALRDIIREDFPGAEEPTSSSTYRLQVLLGTVLENLPHVVSYSTKYNTDNGDWYFSMKESDGTVYSWVLTDEYLASDEMSLPEYAMV